MRHRQGGASASAEKRALVERLDAERELAHRSLHDFLHECRQYPQWQARIGQQNLSPTGASVGEQDRHESRTQLAV
jgi:hypothetical protein